MRTVLRTAIVLSVLAAGLPAAAAPKAGPRVVFDTAVGEIVMELEVDRAPVTACNFLRYVEGGKFAGGSFFRTVRSAQPIFNKVPIDVIQAQTPAGSDDPGLGPIPLERTNKTGLSHVAGAVSMARDGPDTATSSFFIVTEDSKSLDFGGARNPDGQGFAVFARVVKGLDVARAIQARADKEEQLVEPVAIRGARLVDPEGRAGVCRKA